MCVQKYASCKAYCMAAVAWGHFNCSPTSFFLLLAPEKIYLCYIVSTRETLSKFEAKSLVSSSGLLSYATYKDALHLEDAEFTQATLCCLHSLVSIPKLSVQDANQAGYMFNILVEIFSKGEESRQLAGENQKGPLTGGATIEGSLAAI